MRYIPTVVVAFSCDFVVANPTLIKKLSNGHLPFLYTLIIPWMCEYLGSTPYLKKSVNLKDYLVGLFVNLALPLT